MRRTRFFFLVPAMVAAATHEKAQGVADSKAFVQAIITHYDACGNSNCSSALENLGWFSPSLRSLIERDRRANPGFVGKLDFDPVCSCQDPDGVKVVNLRISAENQGRALAAMTFRFPQPTARTVVLELLSTREGWRIDDVSTSDVPSLRAYLKGKQ